MDAAGVGSSCSQTDSVYCDRCRVKSRGGFESDVEVRVKEEGLEAKAGAQDAPEGLNGTQMIQKRLQVIEESHGVRVRVEWLVCIAAMK